MPMKLLLPLSATLLLALSATLWVDSAEAQPKSNIRATRHNLSSDPASYTGTSTRNVVSSNTGTGTTEICVYCHTPHGASSQAGAPPLWNRKLSSQTYTTYSSTSLQSLSGAAGVWDDDPNVAGVQLGQPDNFSKMCLSCHDGTLAVSQVENAPGSGLGSGIATTGLQTSGAMPLGDVAGGYTRLIGTDLSNDHPIAVTFDNALAARDGELRSDIDSASISGKRLYGPRILGAGRPYLQNPGKIQCITCHDPHYGPLDDTGGTMGNNVNNKFLRLNRLQMGATSKSLPLSTDYNNTFTFDVAKDQICLACHTRLGRAWTQSAHADSTVATYSYTSSAANQRDFPSSAKVWNAGCLNCHDTHTAPGSRRLLRSGVFTSGSTTPSIEETCYQCHRPAADGVNALQNTALTATTGVPDIRSEFQRNFRMPIRSADQGTNGNATENHDIADADFLEGFSRLQASTAPLANTIVQQNVALGWGNHGNRHVECTDCHNPHRVIKADTFAGTGVSGAVTNRRTHVPARNGNDATGNAGNIASGALRGIWGIEPSYTAVGNAPISVSGSGSTVSGTVWGKEVVTFTLKKGDPGNVTTLPTTTAETRTATYLTREYQLCFKCHSEYANDPATGFPQLPTTNVRGHTASGTNSVARYTNVAREFAVRATDPPSSGNDQGEAGNDATYTPAGSYPRGLGSGNGEINHRSWHPVVFPTGRTVNERTNGGSFTNIRFPFNNSAKVGKQTMHCSDCHGHSTSWEQGVGPALSQVQGPHGSDKPFLLKGDWSESTRLDQHQFCGNCHDPTGGTGGFSSGGEASHNSQKKNIRPCMWCHVAVPHGWRNKALLVNLNCVGSEGGASSECVSNRVGNTASLTYGPYYNAARLRIKTWQASTNWSENSCDFPTGSKGGDWMTSTCGDI